MPQLIGYGEDALTFRAITERLPELLTKLDDKSDPDSVKVFFRPSFGRRSGSSDKKRGASFGEFDAIVASDAAVYLIEAKWSRSGEAYGKKKKELDLRPEQVRRHKVMRWYLNHWRQLNPPDWEAFRSAVQTSFEAEPQFSVLTVPAAGQHLAKNIEYVLRELATRGQNIVDVLLYCADAADRTCPPLPEGSTFRLISLEFTDVDETGFFPMGTRGGTKA